MHIDEPLSALGPADAAMPPAAGAGVDRKLTLSLPAGVVRQLRARTAGEETTLRALVLEALAAAGYDVPAIEIRDRRRPPGARVAIHGPRPGQGGEHAAGKGAGPPGHSVHRSQKEP